MGRQWHWKPGLEVTGESVWAGGGVGRLAGKAVLARGDLGSLVWKRPGKQCEPGKHRQPSLGRTGELIQANGGIGSLAGK